MTFERPARDGGDGDTGAVSGLRLSSEAEGFFWSLPFSADRFQREAVAVFERGESVVVTAPTGAGKTLIAEAAVHLVLGRGQRAFYTAPIKALSNQKFSDFREIYGEERVGLLTGDNVINRDAPLLVMTTEVLRNMIYSDSDALSDLGVVVLDEVHYLQDRHRGSVWEEIIIHLPAGIPLVNLSATVANARGVHRLDRNTSRFDRARDRVASAGAARKYVPDERPLRGQCARFVAVVRSRRCSGQSTAGAHEQEGKGPARGGWRLLVGSR